MAILVIGFNPGGTAEQDESLRQRLNIAADPPKGSMLRVAGPYQGGWRIISVWESREDFDAFYRDRLSPLIQQSGTPPPTLEISEIQSMRIAQLQH